MPSAASSVLSAGARGVAWLACAAQGVNVTHTALTCEEDQGIRSSTLLDAKRDGLLYHVGAHLKYSTAATDMRCSSAACGMWLMQRWHACMRAPPCPALPVASCGD